MVSRNMKSTWVLNCITISILDLSCLLNSSLEVTNPLLFKPVLVTFFSYLQPKAFLLLDLKHLWGLGDLKPCKILEIMSQNLGH